MSGRSNQSRLSLESIVDAKQQNMQAPDSVLLEPKNENARPKVRRFVFQDSVRRRDYCAESAEGAAGAGAGAGALMFTCGAGAGALGAGKIVVFVSV
jgi:hypothetical protein